MVILKLLALLESARGECPRGRSPGVHPAFGRTTELTRPWCFGEKDRCHDPSTAVSRYRGPCASTAAER